MTDRTALIAQLAWNRQTAIIVAGGVVNSPREYIQEAQEFLASVEKLTRPEPRQCQTLGPQDLDFRPVCDLPTGHTGKHMDGGFLW